MLVCCGACHRLFLNRYIGLNLAQHDNLNERGSKKMSPEFFLIDAATGKPAAAYRTTIRTAGASDVLVKDMQQSEAEQWLAHAIESNFVIAGSNAQSMRLRTKAGGCEAEIWGIGAIHFGVSTCVSEAVAEDAA